MRIAFAPIFAVALAALGSAGQAATMYVHDDDGWLGKVDTTTGDVTLIGEMPGIFTDIAFDPTGKLYGITFSALYTIDKDTAAVSYIGNHGMPTGNALVFGSDGTLYGAGNTSQQLYTIDPATAASVALGSMGAASGGDLAFVSGGLYLASSTGNLVSVNLADLALSQTIGPFGVGNVFGIATADDELYAVGGTTIFKVNLATGAAIDPVSFAGNGLGQAYGQSFYEESGAPPDNGIPPVPLPLPALLLISSTAALGLVRHRRRG